MAGARGKAVKIISFLLFHLPPEVPCKVVFVERDIGEVLASQRQMMLRRGETPGDDDRVLEGIYSKHLRHVHKWLAKRPNIGVSYVQHREAIDAPQVVAERVNSFLGNSLDISAMVRAIDPALYRQRR